MHGDAILDLHQFGFDSVAVSDGSRTRLRGFAFPLPGKPVSPNAGFTVDEAAERVFVANETEVLAIDLATGATAVFSGPSTGSANEPELRAATLIDRNAGTGDLLVQSRAAPFALTAIDGRTAARRHVANPGDKTPVSAVAAVAAHARLAYVALAQPNGLLRVDLETAAVESVSIEIETHIDDLEIDADGGRLFVIDGNGSIRMYEHETLTQLGRFETSPNTNDGSAAYDRANDTLWVWDTNNSTGLYRVSLEDGAATHVRALFFGPGHASMELLHGNLIAFSGLSLYAQDLRAEQLVELWRPE